MNRGLFQNFLVQQMLMGGGGGGGSGASCWSNMNSLRSPAAAPPEQAFPLFPPPNSSSSTSSSSSSSPSSVYGHHHPHHYPRGMLPPAGVTHPNLHDAEGQDHHLPAESWSQLLLGGYSLGEAEDKYGLTTTGRKMENSWEDHLGLIPASAAAADHIKQEFSNCHSSGFNNNNNLHAANAAAAAEEINKAQWNQILPASSPRSSRSNCISTSTTFTPMLDFTNMKNNNANSHQSDPRTALHHQSSDSNNHSNSECNSSTTATGVPLKKARVQGSSSAHSTFKVRKEKLGDRITALHQIVSPFGKTDTASVLLEAIGYIRFLQSQIEALSSPYLSNGSGNINHKQLQQPALTASKETGNSKKRGPSELQELGKNNNDHSNSCNDDDDEPGKKKKQKDLRSRGLCLLPVSFFLHVGGEHVNGADYWASALHGTF